jgi:hypothetical protein
LVPQDPSTGRLGRELYYTFQLHCSQNVIGMEVMLVPLLTLFPLPCAWLALLCCVSRSRTIICVGLLVLAGLAVAARLTADEAASGADWDKLINEFKMYPELWRRIQESFAEWRAAEGLGRDPEMAIVET